MRPIAGERRAVLVDANVLLYAVDKASPHHQRSALWMRNALEGSRHVGMPWQTIGAFLRISTHPRLFDRAARTGRRLVRSMQDWLDAPTCWIPAAGERTAHVLGELLTEP